jgi:LysR family nitrogen assimilation transcriptional regulator
MDVRQIRDFVVVVRCASFAAASRNLRVSQPGLGYQIKQLEEELQVRLLQRHARGVSLTPAGEAFLDHAQSILGAIDNAKLAMAALAQDARQELKIGLVPSLVQALGPVLLESARPDKTRIRLKEAYTVELQEGVMNGSLDVAICLDVGRSPLRTLPIYSEALYLIGPRSDLDRSMPEIPVAKLAGLPMILGHLGDTSRRLLQEAAASAGVKLIVDQEVESQSLLRSLVLHSGRHAVAPHGMFAQEVENGLLSARRIIDPEIRQSVNAVYAPSASAPLQATIGTLAQSILEDAPASSVGVNMVSMAAE